MRSYAGRIRGGRARLPGSDRRLTGCEERAAHRSQRAIADPKEMQMNLRSHKKISVALTLAALAGASFVTYTSGALATAPQGVTTLTLGVARFDDINAEARTDVDPGRARDNWKARITTKGATDVHMIQNTIAPGGTFGWHSHPGPSLVIVKIGTATFYDADDPACAPHVVPAGSGFVDNGQDTHVVRNEGTVDLITEVVSLVPAGFARRIDEDAPANCPALRNG